MKKLITLSKKLDGKTKICVAGGNMTGCTPIYKP